MYQIKLILIRIKDEIVWFILTFFEFIYVIGYEILFGDHEYAIFPKNQPPPPLRVDGFDKFIVFIKMFYETNRNLYELIKFQFISCLGYRSSPEVIDSAMATKRTRYSVYICAFLYFFIIFFIALLFMYLIKIYF